MKICSKCKVEKSLDCFYATKKSKCKECVKHENRCRHEKLKDTPEYQQKLREYRRENKERIYSKIKEWNANNRQRIAARERAKYQKLTTIDPDKARNPSRLYRKNNPDKVSETRRVAGKKYSASNKDKLNAKSALRRATRIKSTPNWLTKEHKSEIAELFTICAAFKLYTGLEYHVDHIVPLQGKTVCGLHVPWNLQVLESSDNIRKSNKFEEV